jgi:diketogulonate reductase-like aldo/keto reductase
MWETLESLVDEGKIRNIGVANYNQRELRELLSYARIKPALNQIEIHPRLPQWDLVRFCHEQKIATTAYSPLGRGALIDEPTIVHLAATHGVSPASVLLRWNLQRGSSGVFCLTRPISPICQSPFFPDLTLKFFYSHPQVGDGRTDRIKPARAALV